MSSEAIPWNMVLNHHYAQAIAAYDMRLETHHNAKASDRFGNVAERATALLCLNRYEEALAGFHEANQLAVEALPGNIPYPKDIACVQWLMGKRAEAIETLYQAVNGITDGTIKYTDFAGGVSDGILLWYGGVSALDASAVEHALKYLRKLVKKSRVQYGPGPLGLFVLGTIGFEDVLEKSCDTSDVSQFSATAKTDLKRRRRLSKVLFYDGIQRRSEGDEQRCLERMGECQSLENPILEPEWYLSRGEMQNAVGK